MTEAQPGNPQVFTADDESHCLEVNGLFRTLLYLKRGKEGRRGSASR
jgi:hypothetical protein